MNDRSMRARLAAAQRVSFAGFAVALALGLSAVNAGAATIGQSTGQLIPLRYPGIIKGAGDAVSINGTTAALGVPGATVGSLAGAGAVLLFSKSGTTWKQTALIKRSYALSGQGFGNAIAIDGNLMAVAAEHASKVYLFTKSSSGWAQTAVFSDPIPSEQNEGFGAAVAFLSTGILTIGFPGFGFGQGGVYLAVKGTSGRWTLGGPILAPGATPRAGFGTSISSSGGTILIGAPGQNGPGAAYVYNGITEAAEIGAPNSATGSAQFGSSVSLEGSTALIGAPGMDVGAVTGAGATYFFTKSTTGWVQSSELTPADATTDDAFGASVALSSPTALIGSPAHDHSGTEAPGAAYVATESGTAWKLAAEFDGMAGDSAGAAVAVSGTEGLAGAPTGNHGVGEGYVVDT